MLDGINAVAAVRKVGIPLGSLCRMRRSDRQVVERKPRKQGDEGTENRQEPEVESRRDDRQERGGEFCGTNGQASQWDERKKGEEDQEGSREDGLPVPDLGMPL